MFKNKIIKYFTLIYIVLLVFFAITSFIKTNENDYKAKDRKHINNAFKYEETFEFDNKLKSGIIHNYEEYNKIKNIIDSENLKHQKFDFTRYDYIYYGIVTDSCLEGVLGVEDVKVIFSKAFVIFDYMPHSGGGICAKTLNLYLIPMSKESKINNVFAIYHFNKMDYYNFYCNTLRLLLISFPILFSILLLFEKNIVMKNKIKYFFIVLILTLIIYTFYFFSVGIK